tara:strand:+ start:116 stop:562 length:447 start_codon:yes stop_codon:yes gene_type:complete
VIIKFCNNYKTGDNNLEQGKKIVHSESMKMRWGEMDALGHMNNVSYFRYFEESRVQWIKTLPVDYISTGTGPVLGTITCRFSKSVTYPEMFLVKTSIGSLGTSSFKMWTEMLRQNDSVNLAEAEATMVWVDLKTGKACGLPDWFKDLF